MQTAKLFASGRSQAVRLPKEFRFEGTEVAIKRVGSAVMLMPLDDPWAPMWEALEMFDPDFRIERDQPTEPDVRPELFR